MTTENEFHQPVLLEEVLHGLVLRPGAVVVDATVGGGGHAEALLRAIGPKGKLIGFDRDREALDFSQRRLGKFHHQMELIHSHFGNLAACLTERGIREIDAALFDLGVSSFQLGTPGRGLSFSHEGPLDMRMDQTESMTASDIVNQASVKDLTKLLRDFGQERWSGRIAKAIVRARPLTTTTHLADVIRTAVPAAGGQERIHPATRSFQALRITVNRELEILSEGLRHTMTFLRPGGRIAVLSYHSLEDRIVKATFREKVRAGEYELVNRKPIRPSEEEVRRNPRSRSAVLRVAQRVMLP